jgi:HrpA-like RNA helicase
MVFKNIDNLAKELVYVVDNNDVILVMGETGSGKSTSIIILTLEIPEYLYKAGYFNIAHILPRKIPTITISQRVAKNMSVTLGKEVGYSVRFDYNYNDETKIKFLTEGMFIREMLIDPLLRKYKVIIIDDCHERTIQCELILGFLKKVFAMRNDLKIIISSATLDYSKFYF